MTKRIVLCADDYGQAPAISQGILQLIQQVRLSATSCMVNAPHWVQFGKELQPFQAEIDIGLHFNLTEGKALSQPFKALYGEHLFPLATLIRRAILGRLDRIVIAAECEAQLDCFAEITGFLPHFIDGHQHVHQFPVVREAVVDVYERRLAQQKAYLRLVNPTPMVGAGFAKKVVIYALGAKACQRLFTNKNIPHNTSFSGIYSFKKSQQYRKFFLSFLKEIADGGLIMCHPGLLLASQLIENNDKISKIRYQEYQYFMSQEWMEDCQNQEIIVQRFALKQP